MLELKISFIILFVISPYDFHVEMKSNTLANSYKYCHVGPCIFSWSITHSLTYFEKTHTYLTLGFRTTETRMYCKDIV